MRNLLRSFLRMAGIGSEIVLKTLLRTNVDQLPIDPKVVSLITPLMKTVSGLYTFKAAILEEPCTCEDLGFASDLETCIPRAMNLCEQLRESLGEPDVNSFNSKVTGLLRNVREDIAKSLHHELLHAYIMQETHALFIAEKYAWRVRFDNMYYMENFYKTVGRELASEVEKRGFKVHSEFRRIDGFSGLDRGEAWKILREIRPALKDFVVDSKTTNILRDGLAHNVYLRYFIHPAVAPIIEVVTWYIMDQDIEETLEDYKHEGIFDEDLHGPVLEKLIEEIESTKPVKQSITHAAKLALDFTQEEYEYFIKKVEKLIKYMFVPDGAWSVQNNSVEEARAAKRAIANEIENFVMKRFVAGLHGRQVPRAPRHFKTLGRVFLYAIPSDIAPDFLLTFTMILREEGLLNIEYLSRVAEASKLRIGEHTAIHLNIKHGERYEAVGCNPLSPFFGRYIKRTSSVLTTSELLVGDLVLALRGFLTLGYTIGVSKRYYGQREILDEFIYSLKDFPLLRKVLLEEPDVYNEVIAKSESFPKLVESPDPKHAYNVIEAFIYAVLVLGDRIKALEGPHGLWYL